jgi:B-box zinc finger
MSSSIAYPVYRPLAFVVVRVCVRVCVCCVCVLVSLTLSASRAIVLPVVNGMEKCNVCQTAFFFDYKDDKLAQRESIYRELHAAVRKVIQHDLTHHSQSHVGAPSSAKSCDSKHTTAGAADADSHCSWQYGSGNVSAKSVSNVCFGALQPTMDKYALLEDMAHHIVDQPSARHLYEKRDDKTGLLAACRRSDRMIDESMNHRDFNATPVLLHCGHTVCRGCAYQCVKSHENAKYDTMFAMVDCPTRCNRQTAFVCDLGVEWLPIDIRRVRLLQEHHKASRKPMCCEHKDRVATARCTHALCADYQLMGAECDKAEHSTRNSSKHIRVAPSEMEAAASASADSLCSTHHLPLTGVCVTDGTPLCGDCVYDHVGHEVKRLHEVCSDWSKKLEALQRETLVRAHVLSDRAASVQRKFDEMMSDISTRCDSLVHGAITRRNQLAFEARRWRKMQLEESKMLAAESSQLSATAMYERMLLQRVLDTDATDSKSAKPAKSPSSSSLVSVPDAVLGSVARQAQSAGSAIESQCVELNNGIAGMNVQDMNVSFDNASHSSLLSTIQAMGTITLDQAHINI